MAFRKRVKAASTHFDNLGTPELSNADARELKNNQGVGVLIAPDAKPGGSTHTTQASTKRKKVTAISIGDLANDEDPTNTGNDIDRNVRPAILDDDFSDLDEPLAEDDDIELVNSGEQSTIESEADDEDEDFDLGDDDEDDDLDDIEAEADDEDEDDGEDDLDIGDTDSMDVVDVDDMPEEVEEDEVQLAVLASSVVAIRGDRIIAKMTRAQAEQEGIADEFESDEFADVVASVCASKGLRAGLSSLGFKMSTVNLAASRVVAAQVDHRAKQVTAKLQAQTKTQLKSVQQCLALAAVGINKGFWKDVNHPLKAAVENTLLHAGVQNPRAVTAKLFAASGLEYAKSMVTVAERLSAMPEATRNTLAEALDFTNDSIDEVDDEEIESEAVDFSDDGSDFSDIDASTIEAALSKPMRRQAGALLTPKAPITARNALTSSDILEF